MAHKLTLPIRHSSGSWNPVPFTLYKSTLYKSLDPGFRWDDERFAIPARRIEAFPGQPWAKAGMTIRQP